MTCYDGSMDNYYEKEQQVILEKIQSVESNYHELSKGEELEEIIRAFLVKNLPKLYGIGTGFIVDSFTGKSSRQLDIIIYNAQTTVPLKNYDKFQVYAIENVVAVISVKKRLKKKSELYIKGTGHIDNLASAKEKRKNIGGQSVYPPICVAFTYLYEDDISSTEEYLRNKALSADPKFLLTHEAYINGVNGELIEFPKVLMPDMLCFLDKGIIVPRPQWRFLNKKEPVVINSVDSALKDFFFMLLSMMNERNSRTYTTNLWSYYERV